MPARHLLVLGSLLGLALTASACGDGAKRRLGGLCGSDGDCEQGICGGGICIDPLADEDHDGLANGLEVDLGTNPVAADTDNDGAADPDELDTGLGLMDLDGDGTADVLESATLDEDGDCIPNQYDAQNTVADAELAGLVDIVCKQVGVCATGAKNLTVVCDTSPSASAARCDYAAVADFEADETRCDGLDNDCDGATDEQAPDLDGDAVADCVDTDDDADGADDTVDVCPLLADPAQGDIDDDGLGDACDLPAPPIVSAIAPASPSSDPAPVLHGMADPHTPIEVYSVSACAGSPIALATPTDAGDFVVGVAATANAETRFWLLSKNPAGLVSACVPSSFSYLHDDQPPAAPTFVSIDPSSPSDDTSPLVTGGAEPATRVALHATAQCTGTPLGQGAADDTGRFTIVAAVPPDAATTLYAEASDAAGNRSACVPLTTYLHDASPTLVAPPLPHPAPLAPASPSDDPRPVLTGCAAANAAVEIYDQLGCLGAPVATTLTTQSDAACDSGFAFQTAVAAAPNDLIAWSGLVRDPSGATSTCMPLGTYLHDDVAPAAPRFEQANPPSPSDVTTPTLFGSAEALATVTLHAGNSCATSALATAIASPDGRFALLVTLPANASTALFARATDQAGNASTCAAFTTWVNDASIPSAPTAHPTAPFSPASPTRLDATPTLRGCAPSDATVDIFTSDGCTGTPVASAVARLADNACPTGFAFTVDVAVATPDSRTTFRGEVENDLGVSSACATLGTFVYDATPPAAPAVTTITPDSPSSSTTPVLSGTAEPAATLTLHHGASCERGTVGTAQVGADGKWTIIGALEVQGGTTRFSGTATDAAGNVSGCGAFGDFVHQDGTPDAPSAHPTTPFAPASPSRSDSTPTLAGCAPPNAAVSIFASDGCTGTPLATFTASTADAACATGFAFAGDVTVTRPTSTTTYRGVVTNALGVRSACATLGTFVFDATSPAPPVLVAIHPASPSPEPSPVVLGSAEAGASVTVYGAAGCAGTATGTARASATGEWAVAVPLVGLNMPTVFSGVATDAAGNVSTCTALGTFEHDDLAPRAPLVLASQEPPQPSSDPAPLIRFCSELGSTVEVFKTDDCSGAGVRATTRTSNACTSLAGTAEQGVTLSINASTSLHTIARDAAGNSAGCQPLFDYAFDDAAPPTPEVLRVKGVSWTMLDVNTVDRVDLEVAGRAEPGASVALFIDGAANGTTIADGDGRFVGLASNVVVGAQAAGPRRLSVRAIDEAGNTSAPSLERTVVGSFTFTITSDDLPAAGVPVGVQFPDGTLFVDGQSNAQGTFLRRIFAGMMGTVAYVHVSGGTTKRQLATWMDLAPGDDIPVDITAPAPSIPTDLLHDIFVTLPTPAPAGATSYRVQTACNESKDTNTLDGAVQLGLWDDCVGTGDAIDVLALAFAPDVNSPIGAQKVVAYTYKTGVVIGAQGTNVTMGPWKTASSSGSTLSASTLTIVNDSDLLLAGLGFSQHHLLGPPKYELEVAGASDGFNFFALPGRTQTVSLPFITEIGPWRWYFAGFTGASFGEGGVMSGTYEVMQGLGTPPLDFGTRRIKEDLLPLVLPDYMQSTGADPDRPIYGWIALGPIERADSASVRLGGESCVRQCSHDQSACEFDPDCGGGNFCQFVSCDEVEWIIGWRAWDADTTIRIPALPGNLPQPAKWRLGNLAKYNLSNIGWIDYDFIDGWDETKALGKSAFLFSEEDFVKSFPDEATVQISFIGDN